MLAYQIRVAPPRSSFDLWGYVAYMRPRTFLVTFVFVATGYALAPGPASVWALAYLFLVYSVLGWGGANAFNSAEDRDEGPVNLLPNPPPRPKHLRAFGIACGALAVALASVWPQMQRTLLPIVLAGVLSFAYSWKGVASLGAATGKNWRQPLLGTLRLRRFKEIGVLDNLTNACGCGPLALAIGWGARAPFEAPLLTLGVGFFLALFGGYTTTQIFQLTERDSYATARNYTSLVGPARALRIGSLAFAAHLLVLGFGVNWTLPGGIAFASWAALVAVAAVHSLLWARAPFARPHAKMLRQMSLMMGSQLCFVVGALLSD